MSRSHPRVIVKYHIEESTFIDTHPPCSEHVTLKARILVFLLVRLFLLQMDVGSS